MPDAADLERRTTELLQRLIRFNTVNPPGNEQAVQEFLKGLLEGGRLRGRAAVGGRGPAEPGRLAEGRLRRARRCACSATWTPCSPTRPSGRSTRGRASSRDGCVWGRGALDMKSQVAAEVAAAVALAEEGWRPEPGELKLVLTADEETGRGARRASGCASSTPTRCARTWW